MAANPLRLRPSELCRLLNSTPLGEVVSEVHIRNHRSRAGMRIGDHRHVNLVSYAVWLIREKNTPRKPAPIETQPDLTDLADSVAALAASHELEPSKKLSSRQYLAIAALLTESTHKAAAVKVGIHPTTLCRWQRLPAFQAALRHAKRKLFDTSVSRAQAASGVGIDALVGIARGGRRDADRIRASVALLEIAAQGQGSVPHDDVDAKESREALQVKEVTQLLSKRLRQIEQSDLNVTEKSRLTADLSSTLLNTVSVHEMKVRLEALESVLQNRPPRKSSR